LAAKVIRLNSVWAMLSACAPGYGRRETDHFHIVTFQSKTYRTLPLGKHGARKNPEIEAGHVRAMVPHFGIVACAAEHLPTIF
jgi:hypothetical protein